MEAPLLPSAPTCPAGRGQYCGIFHGELQSRHLSCTLEGKDCGYNIETEASWIYLPPPPL